MTVAKTFLTRQSVSPQVPRDPRSQSRQREAEPDHPVVLVAVADFGPARVVAVLLAAAGVAAGRLNVPVGVRANPDVGPGGRDHNAADPGERVAAADGLAARHEVAKSLPAANATNRGVVAHVAKAGRSGGSHRIDRIVSREM
jgi:hypothetical protein